MTHPPAKRGRGRPRRGQGLTERAIIDAALVLLEADRSTFSMRAVARALNTDVMAVYHHFPTKQALLGAAVSAAFAPLEESDSPFGPPENLSVYLQALSELYLGVVRRFPGLTLEIASGRLPAGPAELHFDALFAQVVQPLHLEQEDQRKAGHVLVDYLHGFALGRTEDDAWRFGVHLLAQGLLHRIQGPPQNASRSCNSTRAEVSQPRTGHVPAPKKSQ
nr:TetR/AcrR family transcriptional regulator [Deinococcus hopiensis]